MSTTDTIADEVSTNAAGLPVRFYPPRLSDSDLRELDGWADYCCCFAPEAPKLGAYLHCVCEFERERRAGCESGELIVEAYCMPLPTHTWSNAELVAAMSKIGGLVHGPKNPELSRLFDALDTVIQVEAMHRLSPLSESGN